MSINHANQQDINPSRPNSDARDREVTVGPEESGQRLDRWLAERFPQLSRRGWQEKIRDGLVLVNGLRSEKGRTLRPGEEVEIAESPAGRQISTTSNPAGREPAHGASAHVPVLYTDQWIVAVDKPKGLPCHPLNGGESPSQQTALNLAADLDPAVLIEPDGTQSGRLSESDIMRIRREGGLLHRLDNDSSGVLLFARSIEAWLAFRDEIQGRTSSAKKHYLARCWAGDRVADRPLGEPAAGPVAELLAEIAAGPGRIINYPIAHSSRRSSGKMIAVKPGTQKSEYRGSPRSGETGILSACLTDEPSCLVLAEITRGQRHQIRCHLAAAGLPLVGDSLYGGEPGDFLLHHSRLDFYHPYLGKRIAIESMPAKGRFADSEIAELCKEMFRKAQP